MKMEDRSFFVIAYDMTDNRRRAKLARLLESLGFRVQGSVFEGYLSSNEVDRMLKKALKLIDPNEDSIRVYPICKDCREKMTILGQGEVIRPPGLVII
jgi:CRISPR-associated protein Cas2